MTQKRRSNDWQDQVVSIAIWYVQMAKWRVDYDGEYRLMIDRRMVHGSETEQ